MVWRNESTLIKDLVQKVVSCIIYSYISQHGTNNICVLHQCVKSKDLENLYKLAHVKENVKCETSSFFAYPIFACWSKLNHNLNFLPSNKEKKMGESWILLVPCGSNWARVAKQKGLQWWSLKGLSDSYLKT